MIINLYSLLSLPISSSEKLSPRIVRASSRPPSLARVIEADRVCIGFVIDFVMRFIAMNTMVYSRKKDTISNTLTSVVRLNKLE